MDPFSVVLVGKGLLTAGPAPAEAPATPTTSTGSAAVLQLAVQDAEPADVPALPAAVAARVRGALNPAAPAIRRHVTQVERRAEERQRARRRRRRCSGWPRRTAPWPPP